MPLTCCVIGCKSKGNGTSSHQFFPLPLTRPSILTQWLIVLDRRDWIPKSSSKICSLHFLQDDFIGKPNTAAFRLKPDAIPSVFPDLNSSDEKDESDDSSEKEPEVVHKNERVKPNKTKPAAAIPKTPVVTAPQLSESPAQRPRRVSKINPKMKDFILLDDIKKHRQNLDKTPGKSQSAEKDKAARELLSILEDNSLSESDSESTPSKGALSSKISSGLKTSASGEHSSGKTTSQKTGISSVSHSTPLPEKQVHKTNLNSELLKTKDTLESSSDEEVSPVPVVKRRKVATKSTSGGLPTKKNDAKSLCNSGKLVSKTDGKEGSGVGETKTSDKGGRSEAVAYFQVKLGETVYYFSHADLNPTVNMSKNNVLHNQATGKYYHSLEEVEAEKMSVEKNAEAGQSGSNELNQDETFEPDDAGSISSDNDSIQIKEPTPKKPNKKNTLKEDIQETMINSQHKVKRGRPRKNTPLTNTTVNSPVAIKNSSLTVNRSLNLMAPAMKKKRFTTVAEIVVRTDNTAQGPSVSIDQINNFVDIENDMSTAKKIKKPSVIHYSPDCSNHTSIQNVSVIDKITDDEELQRMSDRITDTIRKMKLLERVKGNTAKLTVLITTLPPVQEKEILIIKKKNLITNVENSRELEVAVSSCPRNSSAAGENESEGANVSAYDLPIVGACVKDSNNEKHSVDTGKENQGGKVPSGTSSDNLSSDQDSTAAHSSDVHLKNTNIQEGTGNSDQILNKSDIAVIDGPMDSSLVNEDGENVEPRDHDYISPTKGSGDSTSVNETIKPAEQSKEVFSRLKLSEEDLTYRRKVFKKFRSMKDTIRRKSDAISKLKERIRFLEKVISDNKKEKKRPDKLKKSLADKMYEHIIENGDIAKSMDYSVTSSDIPLEFEENAESEEDERACSSPITYLCEPALETCEKPTVNEQ